MAMTPTDDEQVQVQEICRKLKELRVQKGISQRAIAAEMGLTQGNYSRLESGTYVPRMSTVFVWARALGYKVELVLEKDEGALEDALDKILV